MMYYILVRNYYVWLNRDITTARLFSAGLMVNNDLIMVRDAIGNFWKSQPAQVLSK